LWAGFTALINEAGANAGLPSVGLLNPALYQIAATPAYEQVFNDIQDGSNAPNVCGTSFGANTGWDAVTGLGTPTCGLISAIDQLAHPPEVTVQLTSIAFATSSLLDNFFCNGPATPDDLPPVTITCEPQLNADGSISTNVVNVPPRELECSDHGRGALVEVSCSGTGTKGNISLNVSVTLAIDDCGALQDNNGNGNTVSFTNLVPGVAQVNGNASCDVFTHACAEDACNTNSFFTFVTVSNTGGF
jgi:hypothetical protein